MPDLQWTVPVTDADLTLWESRMPDQGKKVTSSTGSSSYDGKRLLAMSHLAKELLRRGVPLTVITNAEILKDAAVFQELALIYNDMSVSPDDVAAKKAAHYRSLFEAELELVILETTTPGQTVSPTTSSIPLRRA